MRLDPMHYSTHTLMVKEMKGLSGLGFSITSLINQLCSLCCLCLLLGSVLFTAPFLLHD